MGAKQSASYLKSLDPRVQSQTVVTFEGTTEQEVNASVEAWMTAHPDASLMGVSSDYRFVVACQGLVQ